MHRSRNTSPVAKKQPSLAATPNTPKADVAGTKRVPSPVSTSSTRNMSLGTNLSTNTTAKKQVTSVAKATFENADVRFISNNLTIINNKNGSPMSTTTAVGTQDMHRHANDMSNTVRKFTTAADDQSKVSYELKPVDTKLSAKQMWDQTNAIHYALSEALPALASRVPGFQYAETWIPRNAGAEFVGAENHLAPELVEKYSAVASSHKDRVEHDTEMNEISRAFKTKETIIMQTVGKDQVFHGFVENEPLFKSGAVVPVIEDGTVRAVVRVYTNREVNAATSKDDIHHVVNNVVAASVYGNTVHCKELKFRQYNPEVPVTKQQDVYLNLVTNGIFTPARCFSEVDEFFRLGFAPIYFNRFSSKVLSNHIQAFIASKQFASAAGSPQDVWLAIENNVKFMGGLKPEQSFHIIPNDPRKIVAVERNITRRMKLIPANKNLSLEMSMSTEPLGSNHCIPHKAAMYTLTTNDYAYPENIGNEKVTDLKLISTETFMKKPQHVIDRYQEIVNDAADSLSPVAKIYETYKDGTTPVMFAFKFRDHSGPTSNYMLSLTQLIANNDLKPQRKFIESFANNVIVFSLYLKPGTKNPQEQVDKLTKQFKMLHLVPQNDVLTPRFLDGSFSAEEYTYLSAASRLLYYVISQRSDEYDMLSQHFKNDQLNLGRLRTLYGSIRREAVSHNRIMRTFLKYPELAKKVYADFEVRTTTDQIENGKIGENEELMSLIKRSVPGNMEQQIFNNMLSFNKNVPKTNFYRDDKAAVSFRLEPDFFASMDLPRLPYGVFFSMGADFQAFQIRFADVSRGGIRIIQSRDEQAYNKNISSQFQETFNLAFTQNLKNKDIPEFGSKGTVLLNPESQSQNIISFQRFVSSLLDIIVFDDKLKPGDKNFIVNNYGRPEFLFLGPDEGSAGVMEWSANYAKSRGYSFWRSFTTGKPPSLGGIPHDTYGMTTNSVHRYVLGCIEKLGLKESECTKIQTGGPDGDLGSNEILISKDKTIAVIDGSGVAYDPNGLDRSELTRCAQKRVMIEAFDKSKLGSEGFFVSVNDTNVTLPNGDKVESGVQFRNDFHLSNYARSDLFVPCGGRPESINLGNVKKLFDSKTGKPKFRVIVEGANLFITQDARLVLEEAGVVLFKDASTNKGGVTSSSLEVLAALSIPDELFADHMAVKNGVIPEFYKQYVEEVKSRIIADAGHEFECIWREHLRTGLPRFVLTDKVSNKINTLNDFIHDSNLWDNKNLRTVVLKEVLPKRLQELVGFENLIKNAPESYLRASFSAYLASRYVYKYGIDASEFAFYDFMGPYTKKALELE